MDEKLPITLRRPADLAASEPSLTGAGQIVAVADRWAGDGDATRTHIGHSTHSVAPEARLFLQTSERPHGRSEDLGELFEPAYAAGARIHASTWGPADTETVGIYDASAASVDAFLWHHRDMFILFSAGSARQDVKGDPDEPNIVILDTSEVSPPATAKNCLTVGGMDGAPLMAGAVALIRQYLVQARGHVLGGVKPSGALLKALVVNGADSRFFVDEPDRAVETGQIRTFPIEAMDLGRPLNVTLVWTDAPAAPLQGGLCNKLYLQLVEPSGTVLDSDAAPPTAPKHNVQQVTVPEPVAGTYLVRVRGVEITRQLPTRSPEETFRQDFALVASNAREIELEPDATLEPQA